MDLLNFRCGKALYKSFSSPFIGFVTGPLMVITSITQIVLNLLGTVFMFFPSFCISKENPWHYKKFFNQSRQGVFGVFMGVLGFLPFSYDLVFNQPVG